MVPDKLWVTSSEHFHLVPNDVWRRDAVDQTLQLQRFTDLLVDGVADEGRGLHQDRRRGIQVDGRGLLGPEVVHKGLDFLAGGCQVREVVAAGRGRVLKPEPPDGLVVEATSLSLSRI